MADEMKFHVTPEQVEAARAKLAEAGFPISGESGAIEKDGYRIGYALAGGILSLQVLAKPRLVPMMAVRARIRSVLSREGMSEIQSVRNPIKRRAASLAYDLDDSVLRVKLE